MNKKFFITTAIDYVNSFPHLGHAYEKMAADIMARFLRKKGEKVFFLTGTDEHGFKIAQAADKQGSTPKEFVDKMASKYEEAWKTLGITFDHFVRTTTPDHEKFVQDFLQKLYDKGEIYKDKYEGLYCVGCEEYKTKNDLLEGDICPTHNKKCELIQEEIYFFKLSKYQQQISQAIEKGEIVIEPAKRKNEITQFLAKEPLKDLAISRSKVEWGIPLPWDKEQTIYVWVDALLNYISASKGNWPADLQIIGKDIFRFHAIIWPAMLMAGGYELPKKLFIHGFLTVDGQKMSKTIGNVVDPLEIAKVYNVDSLRYFLFREVPFGEDGDFSINRFDQRYQADLANDLGNLFQRTQVMAEKYEIGWKYKEPKLDYPAVDKAMEELRFSDALNLIWVEITDLNRKIDSEKPWELAKTNKQKLNKLMHELLEKLAEVAELIDPFMPQTAEKMRHQLKGSPVEPLFPRKK